MSLAIDWNTWMKQDSHKSERTKVFGNMGMFNPYGKYMALSSRLSKDSGLKYSFTSKAQI